MGEERAGTSLIRQAGVTESLALNPGAESVWIEVIQKMDSVYADLVRSQVELEEKHSALEEAQRFIGSVLTAMTDVLIVCDTEGRIQQVNAALEKLTGKATAEFLGRPIGAVFGAESAAAVERFPERLGHESLVDCEVALLCADGSSTPLAMNCSSRFDHDGGVLGMVLIGRPVGELRRAYDELNRAHHELQQAQEQLVHSEKMASLGRLVAGVAHELNNPISFVFGNMHALQRYGERITRYLGAVEEEAASPRLRELRQALKIDRILDDIGPLIDGTLEGAERVSDIVQDLRRYSGGQKEDLSHIELPKVVRKAVQWVVKAGRVKPEVCYRLPDSLAMQGRKGQLHQILVNLVQNAVDAMENQPRPVLELQCAVVGERVRIDVMDRGPGIPAADLPHIFEPFFTSKPVGQGTGLGLSISYGLARELGGDLVAANRPQGGAVFSLTLPLQAAS
jgi:two-component system sensor histidine kinase HupT/HoxJ